MYPQGPTFMLLLAACSQKGIEWENLAGNAENNDGIDGIGRNCVDLLSD